MLTRNNNSTLKNNKNSRNHNNKHNINGLVQDCSNSIANAMELQQPFVKPSPWPAQLSASCQTRSMYGVNDYWLFNILCTSIAYSDIYM